MSEHRSYFEVRMFSIIDTGWAKALVWFSPGPQTISTIVPRSGHPAPAPREMPAPSLISSGSHDHAERRCSAQTDSHTPGTSNAHESSHTQEFVAV